MRLIENERKERITAPFKSLGIDEDIEFAEIITLDQAEGKVVMRVDRVKEKEIKKKFLEESEVTKSIVNIPPRHIDFDNRQKERRDTESFSMLRPDRDYTDLDNFNLEVTEQMKVSKDEIQYDGYVQHSNIHEELKCSDKTTDQNHQSLNLSHDMIAHSSDITQNIKNEQSEHEIEKYMESENAYIQKSEIKEDHDIDRQLETQINNQIKEKLTPRSNYSSQSKEQKMSILNESRYDVLTKLQKEILFSNHEMYTPKEIETTQTHIHTERSIIESIEKQKLEHEETISPKSDDQLMNVCSSPELDEKKCKSQEESTQQWLSDVKKSDSCSLSINTSPNDLCISSSFEDSIEIKHIERFEIITPPKTGVEYNQAINKASSVTHNLIDNTEANLTSSQEVTKEHAIYSLTDSHTLKGKELQSILSHKLIKRAKNPIIHKEQTEKIATPIKINTTQDTVSITLLKSDSELHPERQALNPETQGKSIEDYDIYHKASAEQHIPHLEDKRYYLESSICPANQTQHLEKDQSIVIEISSDINSKKSIHRAEPNITLENIPSIKSLPHIQSDINISLYIPQKNQLIVPSPISVLVNSSQTKSSINQPLSVTKPLEETHLKSMSYLEKAIKSNDEKSMIRRKYSVNTPKNDGKLTKLSRVMHSPLSQSYKLNLSSTHNSQSSKKLPHLHFKDALSFYTKPVLKSRNQNSRYRTHSRSQNSFKFTERQDLTKDLQSKLRIKSNILKGSSSISKPLKQSTQSTRHSKFRSSIPNNSTLETLNSSVLSKNSDSKSSSFIKYDFPRKASGSKSIRSLQKLNFSLDSIKKLTKISRPTLETTIATDTKPKRSKKSASSMKYWVNLNTSFNPSPEITSPKQIILVYPEIKVTTAKDLSRAYGVRMQNIKKRVISLTNI